VIFADALAASVSPSTFSAINILIGAVGVLLTICGFLLTLLIRRLEKGSELLAQIDKKLEVMDVRVKNNVKQIDKMEKEKDKQDLSIMDIRVQINNLMKLKHLEGE
jgi:hypothetical protein